MSKRFYNPGYAIDEMMRFDHPTNDPKEQNLVSYWPLKAGSKEFFEVPTEVIVQTESGEQTIGVRFWKQIRDEYRSVGVVLIDHKAKQPIHDEDNIALNDKDAKDKAERLWKECMLNLVREHKQRVDEARGHGMTPQRAKGNTAHALKTLGLEDPANDVEDVLRRKQDVSEVDTLKAQLAELQKVVNQALAKGARA